VINLLVKANLPQLRVQSVVSFAGSNIGIILLATLDNNRIRKVSNNGIAITTIAGKWGFRLFRDNGPATQASLPGSS